MLNCRKGPSTLINLVTVLQKGTAYTVIGRDAKGSWWQVRGSKALICWVGDANVEKLGPVEQVNVVQSRLPIQIFRFVFMRYNPWNLDRIA